MHLPANTFVLRLEFNHYCTDCEASMHMICSFFSQVQDRIRPSDQIAGRHQAGMFQTEIICHLHRGMSTSKSARQQFQQGMRSGYMGVDICSVSSSIKKFLDNEHNTSTRSKASVFDIQEAGVSFYHRTIHSDLTICGLAYRSVGNVGHTWSS